MSARLKREVDSTDCKRLLKLGDGFGTLPEVEGGTTENSETGQELHLHFRRMILPMGNKLWRKSHRGRKISQGFLW